jgi:hypothetical protein
MFTAAPKEYPAFQPPYFQHIIFLSLDIEKHFQYLKYRELSYQPLLLIAVYYAILLPG